MKKLLELKALDTEVRELLHTVKTPEGIFICAHMHYDKPTISIYRDCKGIQCRVLEHDSIVFHIEDPIDGQLVDEIIAKIEKVLK